MLLFTIVTFDINLRWTPTQKKPPEQMERKLLLGTWEGEKKLFTCTLLPLPSYSTRERWYIKEFIIAVFQYSTLCSRKLFWTAFQTCTRCELNSLALGLIQWHFIQINCGWAHYVLVKTPQTWKIVVTQNVVTLTVICNRHRKYHPSLVLSTCESL